MAETDIVKFKNCSRVINVNNIQCNKCKFPLKSMYKDLLTSSWHDKLIQMGFEKNSDV